ncbi:hypothetical protein [Roseibium alexandrii]|uniref:hypothetical protein n=1 Tax=Roseibium alexandrii TaxID=388408 RepID=UPI0001947350|nr:hypothetical protein [Roseibium alexandrii]
MPTGDLGRSAYRCTRSPYLIVVSDRLIWLSYWSASQAGAPAVPRSGAGIEFDTAIAEDHVLLAA